MESNFQKLSKWQSLVTSALIYLLRKDEIATHGSSDLPEVEPAKMQRVKNDLVALMKDGTSSTDSNQLESDTYLTSMNIHAPNNTLQMH